MKLRSMVLTSLFAVSLMPTAMAFDFNKALKVGTDALQAATLTDADANSAVGMSPFQWTMALPSDVILDDKLTATATLGSTGTSAGSR